MIEARLALFEDDPQIRQLLTLTAKKHGHLVEYVAGDMDEARATIDGLEEGAVDVAIVDGNLSPGVVSGEDGAEITRRIRERLGRAVVVIGCSASNEIEGVDLSISKDPDIFKKIPAIIAEL